MQAKLNNRIYYLLVFSIFFVLVSPFLLSKGMFLDGVLYATISRNLAEGVGTYFNLRYTNTFMSHPPLVFWIESFLFKIFGDKIYVERFYSVSTYLISGVLIVWLWKIINDDKNKQLAFLPLVFFVAFPLVTWSAVNNVLENTMMIFDLLAVIFIFLSLKKNKGYYIFLSGLSIFLAVMSKGFPGLFPLSAYFWIFLFSKEINFKKAICNTFLLVVFTTLPFFLLLYFSQSARHFFEVYWKVQILGTMNAEYPMNSHFLPIIELFSQSVLSLVLIVILYLIASKKGLKKSVDKNALIMLMIGLSGVIPLTISGKQRHFYLIPTLPFFALSFAFFVKKYSDIFLSFLQKPGFVKIVKKINIFLVAVALLTMVITVGKYVRDKDVQTDVVKIIQTVGENKNISISKYLFTNWYMRVYLARYGKERLITKEGENFMIISKNDTIPDNYENTNTTLNDFYLLKKDR